METITKDYTVTEDTLAILPAQAITHQARVIELDAEILVAKTPLEIIKHSCRVNWEDFEANRKTTTHYTKYEKKIPIIVSRMKGLYAFPTHAIDNPKCSWICLKRIDSVTEAAPNAVITFSNGYQLKPNITFLIFNN